jgi:Zn-dependent peptidase ImmA (M78 family)
MEPKRLKELAQDMANYIVKLSELNSDEIEIKITDKLANNAKALCYFNNTRGSAQIFLASDTIDNEQEAKVVISHELVHALTREFYFYYSYFTSNKIDINICSAAFETAEEAIAERLSKLILILYEARI